MRIFRGNRGREFFAANARKFFPARRHPAPTREARAAQCSASGCAAVEKDVVRRLGVSGVTTTLHSGLFILSRSEGSTGSARAPFVGVDHSLHSG